MLSGLRVHINNLCHEYEIVQLIPLGSKAIISLDSQRRRRLTYSFRLLCVWDGLGAASHSVGGVLGISFVWGSASKIGTGLWLLLAVDH